MNNINPQPHIDLFPCRPFLSFAFPITRLYSREKFLGINYAITMKVLRGLNIENKTCKRARSKYSIG